MSQNPSARTIRESLLGVSRTATVDPVAVEALRADIIARVEEMRRAIDRAFEFSAKGLVSEAASVVTDFPDLAQEADALVELANNDPQVSASWNVVVGSAMRGDQLPRREEIDRLAGIAMRADELRPQLDALRLSAMRREPLLARMRILRKLRAEDSRNRMWLDQIEALENEWLRSMAELRNRAATREELDEALVALETHEWVASVPRGLRDELFAKVKPLRAVEAGARYQQLAEEIHAAASRMDRGDILRLEGEWAAVHQETGRMPSEELTQLVAPAFAWLTRVEQEEAEQRAFEGEVERLEVLLNERRGVAEIEAQVAALRDVGRAAPDGLIERALQFVDAERERVRRRHRLVLAGSVLGAFVLVVVGAIALSLHAAQREREALVKSLRDAVAAKDAARLRPLVEEIRASVGEPGTELSSALVEADAVLAARANRTTEIQTLVANAERELTANPSRTRLAALKQALAAALADAEDAEKPAVQRVDAQRAAALDALDAAATELTTKMLAEVDRALLTWPLPDAWRDAEILDASRWTNYIAALETMQRQLDEATSRADGHEASVSRVDIKRNAVGQRMTEAKSRSDALRVAERDLSEDKLLAPVTSEKQFIERVESALKSHGPVLVRRAQLNAFEQALACQDAYRAMDAWRVDVRPKLAAALGPTLSDRPSPEVAARAVGEIRTFVAANPAAPMRETLTRLADALDPNAGALLWSPQRVEVALATEHLAGIEEVPVKGDRRFYRRPPTAPGAPAAQKDAVKRALKDISDLSLDPEKLSSILAVPAVDITGKPFPNPISLAWGRAESSLATGQSHQVLPIMLLLFTDIVNAKSCDPLLQFRSLRDAAGILVQSEHASGKLRDALEAWQTRCRSEAANALIADWVAAGYDPETVNWRKARTEASNAIASFPDVAAMRSDVERESRRLGDALSALVPVGVLAPKSESGPRVARVSGASEDLFVLARSAATWSVMPITVERGQATKVPDGTPAGPVLIYRRNPS